VQTSAPKQGDFLVDNKQDNRRSPFAQGRPKSGLRETAWCSAFDGQTCRGHIFKRGVHGFEAFDTNDLSLGIFPDEGAALEAIWPSTAHA
jgi:hypothetical protein